MNYSYFAANYQEIKKSYQLRFPANNELPFGNFLDVYQKWLQRTKEIQSINHLLNQAAKKYQSLSQTQKVELRATKKTLEQLTKENFLLNKKLNALVLSMPNILNKDVPSGSKNKIIFEQLALHKLKHKGENHTKIGEKFNLFNLILTTKIFGTRTFSYLDKGSRIRNEIISTIHSFNHKKSFFQYTLPTIVPKKLLEVTGQFPNLKDDCYQDDNNVLIPTSEVTLINLFQNHLFLTKPNLLISSQSNCFRREAGASGKKNHGLIRLHEFTKIEIVAICTQDSEFTVLHFMKDHIANILQMLQLPYRIVTLCEQDIGYTSKFTYDFEVWSPYLNMYVEISSLSTCGEYQAARGNIRYQFDEKKTKKFVTTLNGSCLPIDRLFALMLENYYDGNKIHWPPILKKCQIICDEK